MNFKVKGREKIELRLSANVPKYFGMLTYFWTDYKLPLLAIQSGQRQTFLRMLTLYIYFYFSVKNFQHTQK